MKDLSEKIELFDYENSGQVGEYLNRFRSLLGEDLDKSVSMSFLAVALEAKGEKNVGNRVRALDYLGMSGFDGNELVEIKDRDESEIVRTRAYYWTKNRTKQMMECLALNNNGNEFGSIPSRLNNILYLGVIADILNKGHDSELERALLTFNQRMNLKIDRRRFNLHSDQSNYGDVWVSSKGNEVKADSGSVGKLFDDYIGPGVFVSKPLADRLSLRIGSKIEISSISPERRFWV